MEKKMQRVFKPLLKTTRSFPIQKIPQEKLFAQLLKRHAERIMQDVNECQPVALPVHLARVRDYIEIIRLAINHEMIEPHEGCVSGKQLLYPATVGDFLALLEMTRKQYRAPVYLNQNETTLGQINHKLDLLAGLIAQGGASPTLFQNQEGENER